MAKRFPKKKRLCIQHRLKQKYLLEPTISVMCERQHVSRVHVRKVDSILSFLNISKSSHALLVQGRKECVDLLLNLQS